MIGKLVLVNGVVSKPELNSQLGIALSFDDENEAARRPRWHPARPGCKLAAVRVSNLTGHVERRLSSASAASLR